MNMNREITILKKDDNFTVESFTLHDTFTLYEFEKFCSDCIEKAKHMEELDMDIMRVLYCDHEDPDYQYYVTIILKYSSE
jgi:hypothetical protein